MQLDLLNYPNSPGWKARETSHAAAEAIQDKSKTLREACLGQLQTYGAMTADEIAERLQASILAIRPRISELVCQNKVFDTKARRPNKSGRRAIVWGLSRETQGS